jgi:hypothetical protein
MTVPASYDAGLDLLVSIAGFEPLEQPGARIRQLQLRTGNWQLVTGNWQLIREPVTHSAGGTGKRADRLL